MKAPVTYDPTFATKAQADLVFEQLKKLDWVRHADAPRSEYYVSTLGEPYTYGRDKGRRTYEAQPWAPPLPSLRDDAEHVAGCSFEVCFLNRYLNNKDQLGWHADNSPEMDDARPIVIMTFGAEREIWFRKNPIENWGKESGVIYDSDPPEKLILGHGSICVMAAGMQDTHQHRIPKASYNCGERISLTFRGYVQP